MAKEIADITTIDLFNDEKRPGRPRTNPHSRSVQVKINKRNQVKRDKSKGLKRVEFKIHIDLFEQLDQMAVEQNVSRSQLIESMLTTCLKNKDNLSISK
ncbi:LexA regulated protein [Endozoicomonas sp. G2_1]|uniref:LexA regulated protein n=1 Tax=Endozoicomonas sp. G2_1 TaxID=2821091 RepID=UPI001AD9B637|nr:LexA regulated protein [Endozoicomonas sp. G2_1]MBO9491952.1 LexA regulated protein [Endozoicomonas sp. G2_1]